MKKAAPLSLSLSLFLLFCLLSVLTAGCAARITRSTDAGQVEFEEMVREIRDARLILIGESHDSARDHHMQLQVIEALHASGKRLAIGAEMFTAASQDRLDLWNAGVMDELTFKWLFEDNWSVSWPLYRDIFLYARANRIPVFGLNYAPQLLRKVASHGLESLPEPERALLPPGIACDDSSYTTLLRDIYRSHPRKARSFEDFCAVQMIWNKGMAGHLLAYLDRDPDITVVALVGSLHAIKGGVPAEAGRIDLRVLVPELSGRPSPRRSDYEFR